MLWSSVWATRVSVKFWFLELRSQTDDQNPAIPTSSSMDRSRKMLQLPSNF